MRPHDIRSETLVAHADHPHCGIHVQWCPGGYFVVDARTTDAGMGFAMTGPFARMDLAKNAAERWVA